MWTNCSALSPLIQSYLKLRSCKDAAIWMMKRSGLRELGTRVEEKFLSGSAFDELVTAATKFKAGLVVLGAVGHGLARRVLLGSVAERTAESSPIPTLVVRPTGGSLPGFAASTRSRFLWDTIFPPPAMPLWVG